MNAPSNKTEAVRGSWEGNGASFHWYFETRSAARSFAFGVLLGMLTMCAALTLLVISLVGVTHR